MRDMMQAAVLHAPGDLRVQRIPIPEIGNTQVLVKVVASGICGSDIGRVMVTGTYRFPTVPGHEFCGQVVKAGNGVTRFAAGDRVLVAPLIPCYECEMCRQGYYGQCDHYNFLGSRTDGGFAEYVKVPQDNLIRLPDNVSYEDGAVCEPAAVTLHGMRNVCIHVGETVAVLGCGAIGLFAVQFARILGATKIIAVDVAQDKLELAKTVGATHIVSGKEQDAVQEVRRITGAGADVCVETAGVALTQEQSLRLTRKQGRILYLGTAHADVIIPPKSFECIVRGELKLVGAWNSYSAPFPGVEWHAVLEYIADGRLKTSPLITHRFPLRKAPEVFADILARKYSFNKILFLLEEQGQEVL